MVKQRKPLWHRQMVSLTKPQIDFLKAEADVRNVSVADLLRRIVDEWRVYVYTARKTPTYQDAGDNT